MSSTVATAVRRAVRRRFAPRGVILMYHRITAGIADPWRLCVAPENFDQHLQVLRDHFEPASLCRLVSGTGLRHAMVAVTFDDGYADNLHHALPCLERHGIPATFFLTSGMLGATTEFWWDELERLLLAPQQLPSVVQITVDGTTRAFPAGAAATSMHASDGDPDRIPPWDAAPTTRLGCYYRVWQYLRTLSEASRRNALAQLCRQLGDPGAVRQSHRTLTRDEAARLAAGARIDIGAHSVTHAALPLQSAADQRREMLDARRDLETLVGRPIRGFAYPYGDLDAGCPGLARELGFDFACTTAPGHVTRRTQPFLLPRIAVEDCSGATLERRLQELL